MKLLLVRSHPRAAGYTRYCTDFFKQGAVEAGADIIDVDLCSMHLEHCRCCYECWTTSPGICVIADDMSKLLTAYLDADILVLATPLNAYGVNSRLKIFLDRTLPLTKPGFVTTPSGLVRNQVRHPQCWPKKLAAIAVGAFKGDDNFSAITKNFQLYAQGLDLQYCGTLIRPESFLLQFSLAKPKTVKLIEAAFIKAGYQLATEGAISDPVMAQAALPLAPSIDYFEQYSNIYWEHAAAGGDGAGDVATLQNRVTSDVRILMREMARSIDPIATARLKAVFQFDFPDKALYFRITVNKGACALSMEQSADPDLRISCSSAVWAHVFTRQINVREALVKREIVLQGDKSLFSRLDRYFPPPVM